MTDVAETFLPIRTSGGRPPLYCVHPISGSAYIYTALAALLSPDQPIWGLEAPGFDDGRDPCTTLDGLSAEYVSILRQFSPEGPYHLLGYSMGGAIAFDMAQRLSASGQDVPLVVIIDTAVPKRMELPSEKAMLRRFVRDMMWVSDLSPYGLGELFGRFPEAVRPRPVLEEIERAAIFPPEMDAEFLQDRYFLFRAHIGALFAYEARMPYHGRVVLLKAAGTPAGSMVWTEVASDVEEHVLPGDHYSIWTGPGLRMMGEIIRRCLDSVQHSCVQGNE